MDGVIVDSELHWKSLESFFLSSLVPAWGSVDQSKILGLSMDHIYTLLTSEYGLQTSREQFMERYDELANEIYEKKTSLLPGVADLLAKLNQHQIPVALASSSPKSWINIVLRRFALHESFQAVVSADDVNGEGKPSPAIYLLAARLLNVPPSQCIAIEDSTNGVISAKNADMFCIGLSNGFNEDQDISRADMIIYSFKELDFNIFLKER
jgi:HAD superfamily hydrolase (TIGR01509 family)